MGYKRNKIYDIAYKYYKKGLSLEQVANNIGVTRQSVYKAFKRRGFELRKKTHNPTQYYKGEKFSLRSNGYFSLTSGKRTLMHRFVWEDNFGAIPQGYDIHHINGDRTDNRIENLECLSKSEHTRKYSPHNNQYTKGRKVVTH